MVYERDAWVSIRAVNVEQDVIALPIGITNPGVKHSHHRDNVSGTYLRRGRDQPASISFAPFDRFWECPAGD
jgi:hypothetical protein